MLLYTDYFLITSPLHGWLSVQADFVSEKCNYVFQFAFVLTCPFLSMGLDKKALRLCKAFLTLPHPSKNSADMSTQ